MLIDHKIIHFRPANSQGFTVSQQFSSNVAAGSGHPDYLGHLGHFLSGSKWVSPGHAYVPDPDQNY